MTDRGDDRRGGRPSLLFVLNPRLGHVTVRIRGLIFKELFERAGWRVEYVQVAQRPEADDRKARRRREDEIVRLARGFDLVYLLKVNSRRLVEALVRESSAKVVFDLTDALWKPYHRQRGWRDLEPILAAVDAVFSENEWICEFGRSHNPRVHSIPACTQVERFDEWRARAAPRDDGGVVVGWVGSNGTVTALETIRRPLEALAGRHPELRLRILGCTDPTRLPRFERVRCTVLPTYDEDDMIREILLMDIGVFPPPFDIEDYCVRGALKGMLYMSGGVPPVFQDAGDCKSFIRDGWNGMLATSEDDWTDRLERLVASPDLRREMGRRALATVRERHGLETVFAALQSALLDVDRAARSRRSPWWRRWLRLRSSPRSPSGPR